MMKGASVLSKERLTDYIEKQKICDYIQGWINPYGKPFGGTVYEFGLKIMDYIKNSSCDEDVKELKQYRDLEEQGLILRLPCKVGDTVWEIVYECEEDYAECQVSCNACHIRRLGIEETKFAIDMIDDVGNWFFLTQSEAEEKLRELEGK